jgi:hypothetical protein
MNRRKSDSMDDSLAALVDALAVLLMSLSVTPAHLAQLFRVSFVKAASAVAVKRKAGTLHLAKIAAITGLSRAEVKRIVASDFLSQKMGPETAPRALRVLAAWKSDKRFSTRGRPLPLRLAGKGQSFESLCKIHSGDIPPKVILAELFRGNLVRIDKRDRRICYERKGASDAPQKEHLQKLAYAAMLLRSLGSGKTLSAHSKTISGAQGMPDTYVREAVVSRVSTMIDDLPGLFPRKPGRASRAGTMRVFALVTDDESQRKVSK